MLRIKKMMISLVLVFVLISGSMAGAQTVSVKLQEGIYLETTGNLAAAMTVYKEIIADSEATDTQAATAMYRLGMCQLMTGDKEQAAGTFKQVITRYPEENSVVEKAGDQLDKLNIGSIGKVIQVSLPEDLQGAIDAAEPNDTVILGKGTYTQPVKISKPITLRGTSRTECVFEVTANLYAICIETQGVGKTKLEDLTVKWQRETFERYQYRGAVVVNNSQAQIEGCVFKALGNHQRSQWGVNIEGSSYVNIIRSRFEGFRTHINCQAGGRGKIQDCLVMGAGAYGIWLQTPDTELELVGNVICGAGRYGIRNFGGKLKARDNLIIDNHKKGIVLTNTASGPIVNNVIIGNTVGVRAYNVPKTKVENNIIMNSDSCGIHISPSTQLTIKNNIFKGNKSAIVLESAVEESGNTILQNTLWDNINDFVLWNGKTVGDDIYTKFVEEPETIRGESCFVDSDNGNFALTNPVYAALNQGLTNPEIFIMLWNRWKNRADPNEPFIIIW